MSKKTKFMILLIVVMAVSILLISILIRNAAKEKTAYKVVMNGKTTTVNKELTEEDYDIAQKILKERAIGNISKVNLEKLNQSESVQRAIKKLEMKHKLASIETEKQNTNNIEEGIPQMPKSIIEEEEKMKKELEDIAKKYNKFDQYNKIMKEIEKQEDSSEFTEERIQICELFINIYNNNELEKQEKNSIKSFLEVVDLGDVPNSLQRQISALIDQKDRI